MKIRNGDQYKVWMDVDAVQDRACRNVRMNGFAVETRKPLGFRLLKSDESTLVYFACNRVFFLAR